MRRKPSMANDSFTHPVLCHDLSLPWRAWRLGEIPDEPSSLTGAVGQVLYPLGFHGYSADSHCIGILLCYIATLAAMGYCSSMNNERISTGFGQFFFERLSGLVGRVPHEFPKELIPAGYRPAAVLLMFWPVDSGGVEMVLTRRTEQVPSHRGQVSFPGGGVADNETHESAALRESFEELGIAPELVTIMGRLDDAWSRQGHHVIPYVGWLEKKPVVTPNPREVAEVLFADMQTLLRPESSCEHRVQVNGEWHTTQAFQWNGGYVWGLTADLLLELILWIKGFPSNRGPLRQRRMEGFGL